MNQVVPWREPSVADIVIHAVLRHGHVDVTRAAYIKNDGIDVRSLAEIGALEPAVCNQNATDTSRGKLNGAVN